MFKARKTRPLFSQKSRPSTSQSSNTENESENIPLGQRAQTSETSNDDDDLFIQPSQAPSLSFHEMRSQRNDRRRFLSQRSQNRYTLSQTQGPSTTKTIPKSYFETILSKTEVNFADYDFYVLNCDIFRFQNRFEEALRASDDYPGNLPILISDVKKLLNSSEYEWRKLLTTIRFTMTRSESQESRDPDNDSVIHESIGNSMLKILLQNKSLQKEMLVIVFEDIRKRIKPENESQLLDLDLVIRQMKFIDCHDTKQYVFKQYFEILSQCNQKAREMLINGLDDFVEMAKHNEAMDKIMEQITSLDELFTHRNLEAFGNLCLNTPTLNKVRAKIIHFIKNGAPKILLKSLLTFMTRFNEDETETYYEVINDIRNCIRWDLEEPEIKVELFNLVKRTINRCIVTRKNWLKAISYVTNARDHKIVDPIACFIMGMREEEKISIESFFKKRVKEKLFTIDLIQQMARNASEVLPNYTNIMTDIFKACFCEKDKYTAFFGAIGFRILFKKSGGQIDHRYPLQKLISLASTRPNDLPFLAENDIRTNVLELLLEIKRRLKNEVDGVFAQVEKILDRSAHLTIDQYRILIKILCSLAYDGIGHDKIKTDLDLMAPKHVTNMHLRIKLQGIIIVFQILDKTMWTDHPDEDSMHLSNASNSTISLSQIPEGIYHESAKLLKLSLKACAHSIDGLMLYYDELAATVSCRNKSMDYHLKNEFMYWLHEQILFAFQNNFILDSCPEGEGSNVEMDYLFNINVPQENEELNTDALQIGMNIGGLVLNKVTGDVSPCSSILLMCPMFNALSAITYRKDSASLETMDALLGCALILPKDFFNEEKLLQEHGGLAIDMYFQVANWFRCVISAFSSQRAKTLRKKVLHRVTQLIDMEASIKFLLQKGDPSYDPPQTTFQIRDDFKFVKPSGVPKRRKDVLSEEDDDDNDDDPGKKKRKPRKKQKSAVTHFDEESMNLNLNETTGNLPVQTQFNIQTQGTQSAEVIKHKAKYWFSYGPKEKYRQLDIDIMILLEENLEIVYPVPENEIGNCLHLQELKFILADLISKTESIAGVKKFRSQQQTQNLISSQDYIHDLIMSLRHVIRFKKQLAAFLREKTQEMDSDDTAVRFSDETNHAKICFGSCLHLLSALFLWPNFCIDEYHDLLRSAMKTIIEPVPVEGDLESIEEDLIEELAEQTLNKIIEDEKSVLDLRSAVHLLHLVKALAVFADKPETVVTISEKLLKREWFALDGTKESNKNADILLTEILKCFMRDMELPKLEEVVEIFSEEMIELKSKSDYMPTFPNFNRSNCTIFYRVIAVTCEQAIKHCVATMVRTKDLMECWKRTFEVLQILLVINEKNPILTNTNTFLRYSHSIMKIFRSYGVKTMEKMVNRDQQSIQDLLRSMQKTTRFLHNLSCDTKARSNSRVLQQVPKLRETMEKLVLEIKSTLAGNHALSGFWLANLTNKNVQGDVLLSQIQNNQEDDIEEVEMEDDLESPENSDNEENEEEVSTPSVVSSRSSKIFD